MTTHLLFDFFGTLVDYSPSRTEQGYARSYTLVRDAGASLAYDDFLALWSEVSAGFDRAAAESRVEFSMEELGHAFFERAVGGAPDGVVRDFVGSYLAEWNRGVRYLDGLPQMLERLRSRFRLGIITNTHDAGLVPAHLDRMGVGSCFDTVITSVEFGRRKPAPEIFRAAIDTFGVAADRLDSIFDLDRRLGGPVREEGVAP